VITLGDLFDGAGSAAQVMVGDGAPPGQEAVLDADKVQRIAQAHGLDWDNAGGLRRILVRSTGGRAAPTVAARTIDVLTYARDLAAGDVIQAEDVVYGKVSSQIAPQNALQDPDAVIGKMARRPLRAGAPAALRDVVAARVIKRDDPVQVLYRSDGVSLTLHGVAQASAAVGEVVPVMNTASKRIVEAVAVGPDEAVVGPDADRFRQAAALPANQFAALH
jgi:flagella basal body P-ring formation protein FlgA